MSQILVFAVLLLALLITSHYQLLQTEMKLRLVGITDENNLDNILGKLLMWSTHTHYMEKSSLVILLNNFFCSG